MPAEPWDIEELIWSIRSMNQSRFLKLTLCDSDLPCYVVPGVVVAIAQETRYTEILCDRGVRWNWHVRETAAEIVAMIDPPKEMCDVR